MSGVCTIAGMAIPKVGVAVRVAAMSATNAVGRLPPVVIMLPHAAMELPLGVADFPGAVADFPQVKPTADRVVRCFAIEHCSIIVSLAFYLPKL